MKFQWNLNMIYHNSLSIFYTYVMRVKYVQQATYELIGKMTIKTTRKSANFPTGQHVENNDFDISNVT